MKKIYVDWDTDGEPMDDLPNVVEYDDEKLDEMEVSDWLSDEYGFCVNDWFYV